MRFRRPAPPISSTAPSNQRGIALLLVIFLVALASILVVNLAYSTNLSARLNAGTLQGLQAEYLLKSAVNLARVLIKEDTSPDEDSFKDPWGKFFNGIAVPGELLGLQSANIHVELEIRPEEAKIPLRALVPFGQSNPDIGWRDAITRLFRSKELSPDFDTDEEEIDQTGLYRDRHFKADELVANLIDYMDKDKDSYSDANFASGIESDGTMPDDLFPNEPMQRVAELAAIPGFTPTRVRKLLGLATCYSSSQVNINVAPPIVLKALSEQITDTEVAAILSFRDGDEGPFSQTTKTTQLENLIGQSATASLGSKISAQSRYFQVIAKVDSGNLVYFARAYIVKASSPDELPTIKSLELF